MIEKDLEDLKNDNNYNAPIIVKHYKDSRKHKKYDQKKEIIQRKKDYYKSKRKRVMH